MRFKRLRKNVAISLVIFFLVVGGIIASGLIQRHIRNVNSQLTLGAPIYTNRGGVIQPAPQNTQANAQPSPTQQAQQQYFFNTGIRTRAS